MRLFIVSRDWETNEKREIQNKRKNSELRTQASHAFIYWKREREKSKKGKRKIEKGKGIRERREERKKERER